jgi:hypothetical protein
MGGIGKTSLSVKFAQQVQDKFEYVIWRSLKDAPPVQSLLASLIQFLSGDRETEADLPERLGDRISRLLDYLRQHRCLLVLDNAEAILRSGSRVGQYLDGYEGYGELLRRLGEVTHKSCLVLTSREKPKEVASLEGDALPVRSLRLKGLTEEEGRKIFAIKGLCGSESELRTLTERFAGNALVLKVVATTILDLFDGNISEFLKQDTVVFGDIRDLLDQQFERLSNLEKDIIYWLTINREPISISELCWDFVAPVPQSQLLEALESLVRRSLVEKNSSLFTLQPVVMEYVTHRLIEQVCREIVTQNLDLFRTYALLKAQAKDYVKNAQIRLILQPVINHLIIALKSKISLENKLMNILKWRRETSPLEPGYIGGNALNLLKQLQTDLSRKDFSYLTVWQADLRGINLHNVYHVSQGTGSNRFIIHVIGECKFNDMGTLQTRERSRSWEHPDVSKFRAIATTFRELGVYLTPSEARWQLGQSSRLLPGAESSCNGKSPRSDSQSGAWRRNRWGRQ